MQKNRLFKEKIISFNSNVKKPKNFSKNRKILDFLKIDPYCTMLENFQSILILKNF